MRVEAVGYVRAFTFASAVVVSNDAKFVSSAEFLSLLCNANFLRTSPLTGMMDGRYFYTETVPEDIYSNLAQLRAIRKALGS
jgi:hypothetical protein